MAKQFDLKQEMKIVELSLKEAEKEIGYLRDFFLDQAARTQAEIDEFLERKRLEDATFKPIKKRKQGNRKAPPRVRKSSNVKKRP